jgi:hypothetical protein
VRWVGSTLDPALAQELESALAEAQQAREEGARLDALIKDTALEYNLLLNCRKALDLDEEEVLSLCEYMKVLDHERILVVAGQDMLLEMADEDSCHFVDIVASSLDIHDFGL